MVTVMGFLFVVRTNEKMASFQGTMPDSFNFLHALKIGQSGYVGSRDTV